MAVDVDGDGDEELLELNHQQEEGSKRVNEAVSGEADFKYEDEQMVNGVAEDVKDENWGATQAQPMLQMLQQQPQSSTVCWQRFLHLRSLKVLLVENDDCTRYIVTALLRNCSYGVIETANGMQAWKILEDLTNHIDIVLTEVVMPCISGIALLSKIMSHKTRKNIPVIMMSSHDSMGLVFKCLSKGAVDFLVKPIRKNELKNLWQHVWRRCHSSSGSGSESGTQTQKSVKSKSVERTGNNTGSNDDEEDNGSIGLNVGDGSDDGSGTLSSWTKQAAEVDCPRPMSPWNRIAEGPDSTCAQVIHPNVELSSNKLVPLVTAKEIRENYEKHKNASVGKDLDIGVPGNVDLHLDCQAEVPSSAVRRKQTNKLETGSSKCNEHDKRHLDLNSSSPSGKLKSEAAKLTCGTTKTDEHSWEGVALDRPKLSDGNDKGADDAKEQASLEIELKRLRGVKDAVTVANDERNVLRRSDSSAFSRYNASSIANRASTGNAGSTSMLDNRLEVATKGSAGQLRSRSTDDPLNQLSKVGSNNPDMGSTTNNAFIKPPVLKNVSAASPKIKSLHLSRSSPHVVSDLLNASQNVPPDKADSLATKVPIAQSVGLCHEFNIQQHPQEHRRLLQTTEHDDLSLKKMAAAAPQCGSSNILGRPAEGHAGTYSVNGSVSGSNHGSNGQNGSSTAMNTGGANMESYIGAAGKSGSGDASGSGSGGGSGNGVDHNKVSQRQAVLTKFRQKRKERCFRTKVRYQSRKRLAEQQPRVRGQFVRQTDSENTSKTGES